MPLSVPVPRTWSVGDVVTGALANTNIRDALNFLLDPTVFVGTDSGAQTLTTGTDAALSIGTEVKDPYSGHSGTAATFVVPVALAGCRLRIYGACSFTANTTGLRRLYLRQNSVAIPGANVATGNGGAVNAGIQSTATVVVAAGDTLDMVARQDSGGNLATLAGTQILTIEYAGLT